MQTGIPFVYASYVLENGNVSECHTFKFYCPRTKLGEGNVFLQVSVSHSVQKGMWVSLVSCPFWGVGISGTKSLLGWVSLGPGPFWWVGMSRECVATPSPDMGPGIQWDMVDNQVVCILLECFLVFGLFQWRSVYIVTATVFTVHLQYADNCIVLTFHLSGCTFLMIYTMISKLTLK